MFNPDEYCTHSSCSMIKANTVFPRKLSIFHPFFVCDIFLCPWRTAHAVDVGDKEPQSTQSPHNKINYWKSNN
uniref:Uncharacterized protein n=1 Tax=Anguilla anguilla TaxID=7936 RepID=A0A0E9WSE3_ANGAN